MAESGAPGAPGPRAVVPAQVVEAKELERDPRLVANTHKYQLFGNVLFGGTRMIRPPAGTLHPVTGMDLLDGSYLTRLPGESSHRRADGKDAFKERLKRAAPGSTAQEVLNTYADYLWRQETDRSAVLDLLGPTFMADVDLKGMAASDWLKKVYLRGLAQGAVLALVDYPRVDEDEFSSLLEEEEAGLRPYVRMVPVTRLWQWERAADGRFVYALIREAADRFRAWYPGFWLLLNEKGERLDAGVHALEDRVPLELFEAKAPDEEDELAPLGMSALETIAYLQLRWNQHASLLDDNTEKTAFPFLHGNRDEDEMKAPSESDKPLGADVLLLFDGVLDWKAPPKECADQILEYLGFLEGQMYRAGGVHRRSQDSVEAHSGLALDFENSPIYATVQSWARQLRSFELRLWRMVGAVWGRPADGLDVVYPDDFTERPFSADIGQAKALADLYGGYATAPSWVKAGIDAKVRRAVRRDVGHVRDMKPKLEVIQLGEDLEPVVTTPELPASTESVEAGDE